MSLIAMAGFEIGTGGECDSLVGTCAVSTTQKKTGSYSLRCNPTSGTGYASWNLPLNCYSISFYLYIASAPDQETIIGGHSVIGSIRLTSDRYLKAYYYTTLKGSGTTQLSTGTWYRISGSSSSATGYPFKVYLNGVEEISGNMDNPRWDAGGYIYFGICTANTTADVYVDDIILDTTDSTNDIGDIRVAALGVDGDGDEVEFDGYAGSATHYENVDDAPGSLSDADYNIHDAKTVVQEYYNFESCSEGGIGGSDTINAVESLYRWKLAKDGDDLPSVIVKDNSTTYTELVPRDSDDVWYWDKKIYETMPNGGGSWTQARVNAFQAGLQSSGDAADVYISNIFLTVAYTPAGEASATNMQINISDVWKDIDSLKINIGDSWKTVAAVKMNIGDSWKTVF